MIEIAILVKILDIMATDSGRSLDGTNYKMKNIKLIETDKLKVLILKKSRPQNLMIKD